MADGQIPPLSPTIVAALTAPTQTTISKLIVEYGWQDKGILEALLKLRDVFNAWSIECAPPVGEKGLDDERVIARSNAVGLSAVTLAEIVRGEGDGVELKETLLLDVKKHVIGGQPLDQCFSATVLHSSLKTVAAFLNGGGGVLLIGVNDKGNVTGIEREFPLIPGLSKGDFDGWELYFRSMIEKYFYKGRALTASVRVSRIDFAEGIVARVVVGGRRELCLMKSDQGNDQLFIRTGNRTLSVSFCDIEEYFTLQKIYS